MNRSESKFHNTAVKFDNALLELLNKKNFTDISIKEICETAGVNRSTFYLHYDNIYDLLKEIQRQIINEFISSVGSDISGEDIPNLSADELIFASPKYLVPYLQFIKSHKKIFMIYMNNLNHFDVESADKLLTENVFVPIYRKYGVTDKKVVTYMSKYYLSGITAITQEWVRNDCEDDIALICEIIIACIRPLPQS